jgi:hypothetical protein
MQTVKQAHELALGIISDLLPLFATVLISFACGYGQSRMDRPAQERGIT